MQQGVDGETDEHYPANPGKCQLMTLIQRAHPTSAHIADQNSVCGDTANEAWKNQLWTYREYARSWGEKLHPGIRFLAARLKSRRQIPDMDFKLVPIWIQEIKRRAFAAIVPPL